jgi:hypothetical protein
MGDVEMGDINAQEAINAQGLTLSDFNFIPRRQRAQAIEEVASGRYTIDEIRAELRQQRRQGRAARAPVARARAGPRQEFVRRHTKSMAISPKVARYLYRVRRKRPVSARQRMRMQALGQKWGPVLATARGYASTAGRGRISKEDYRRARAAHGYGPGQARGGAIPQLL